jgi:hypothetical protein
MFAKFSDSLDAIHVRHLKIDQCHRWAMFQGHLHRNHQAPEQPLSHFSFSAFEEPFLYNSFIFWCPEGDLNPHDRLWSADFKSAVSADFTIRAERRGAAFSSYRIHYPFHTKEL